MNMRSGILGGCALAIVMALFAGGIALAEGESMVDTCLACHGPFDRLIAATSDFKWDSGEVTSPHRYVPHDSQTIDDCTYCHKPHPIPPTKADIAAMAKPNPSYCYGCHHTQVLTCGTCHPIPSE